MGTNDGEGFDMQHTAPLMDPMASVNMSHHVGKSDAMAGVL